MNWCRFALEPVADDLFGPTRGIVTAAQGIDVGRVEESIPPDAAASMMALLWATVALQAERHRPEAQLRDAQAGAAQFGVVHYFSGTGVISGRK